MKDLVLRFRLETMGRTLQDVASVQSALAMAGDDLAALDQLFRYVPAKPGKRARETIGRHALSLNQKLRNSVERLAENPNDPDVEEDLRAALAASDDLRQSAKTASEVVERLRQRWVDTDDDSAIGLTLNREMVKHATQLGGEIDDLENALLEADDAALARLWSDWRENLAGSRPLLDEYVDLLGGLALRTVGLCHEVCGRADTLLGLLLQRSSSPPWSSVAVPAHVEVLRMTPAQIIRLGFPGWSIWELPLAAHEFGYAIGGVESAKTTVPEAVVEQIVGLLHGVESAKTTVPEAVVEQIVGLLHGVEAAKSTVPEAVVEQIVGLLHGVTEVERHHAVAAILAALYADGFAAFALGPAYACAALLLRLDPTRAVATEPGEPPGPVRARMICSTLLELDVEFGAVVGELQDQWLAALAQAGGSPVEASLGAAIDEWCGAVVAALRSEAPNAEYTARRWAQLDPWVRSRLDVTVDTDPRDGRDVRDVLNAAWSCRLDSRDDTEELTKRAATLWDAVVADADVRTDKLALSRRRDPAEIRSNQLPGQRATDRRNG